MNTSNFTVDQDECLSYLAELGRLTRELSINDQVAQGYAGLAEAVARQRQAIDEALQLTNWAQPDVLESVEELYSEALGNVNDDIRLGLTAYLDHLSGVQVPFVNTEGKAITFGVICAADMTHFDEIGAFKDVGPLRAWVANHLSVSATSISVHPMPGMPDTILEGLYDFTAELGRAMSNPLPEDYIWSYAEKRCEGNATDIVFWVSYSSESADELQRVADLVGHDVSDEKGGLMTLPFQMRDGARELELFPCAVMWPFSAFVEHVFNPVLDALEDTTARLEERGFGPETISAELTISLEESNLYGFDESLVVELRDMSTGFILARVPGFGAALFDMFSPYFVSAAIDFGFEDIVIRPGNGAPTEHYEREAE
jgi:hypothetical protein